MSKFGTPGVCDAKTVKVDGVVTQHMQAVVEDEGKCQAGYRTSVLNGK